MKYKLHNCDPFKGEQGKYQILELFNEEHQAWRCCGVYFNKKDALEDLKHFNALNLQLQP